MSLTRRGAVASRLTAGATLLAAGPLLAWLWVEPLAAQPGWIPPLIVAWSLLLSAFGFLVDATETATTRPPRPRKD